MKLLFFLLIMTLNLSKSVKLALLALKAIFLAIEVAVHFSFILKSSAAFLYFREINRLDELKRWERDLLDSAGSGALKDIELEGSETESLHGVLNTGEACGGSIDEDSAAVNNINNHANLAKVLSEVHVCNSTRLDVILEHLKILNTISDDR